MKVYNTLTRRIEEFIPLNSGKVNMYVCGPTVYDFIHIGNARPMVIFDCLRHYLEYRGFDVVYVQNFTDVDDKIINRANEQGVSFDQVVEKYISEYELDAKGLLVEKPTVAPRVSENIESIIEFVQKLIDKGFAYESGGDVFFKTSSFKDYGKLSKMDLNSLKVGKRVNINELKQDELDFVLWKAAKPKEPSWKSPWGDGRPGWHIECSVMSGKYAAKTLDIHCGGQDLIFPHHENEIAQSESANEAVFSNYWMHNGYIQIDNKKMSKSEGNFLTVRQLSEEFGYEVLRYMLIQAHYRAPINFSRNLMEQCKSALARIKNFRENLQFAIEKVEDEPKIFEKVDESVVGKDLELENGKIEGEVANEKILEEFKEKGKDGFADEFKEEFINNEIKSQSELKEEFIDSEIKDQLNVLKDKFLAALDNDFNTADAVSVIFDLIRTMGDYASLKKETTKQNLQLILDMFNELVNVLKIANFDDDSNIPQDVLELFEERNKARKVKNFELADSLRSEIEKRGYIVEETRKGSRLILKAKKQTK